MVFANRRNLSNHLSLRLARSTREKLSRLAPAFAMPHIAADEKPPYATLWDAVYRSGRVSSWGWMALAMAVMFALLCAMAFVNPVALGMAGAMILFFLWGYLSPNGS